MNSKFWWAIFSWAIAVPTVAIAMPQQRAEMEQHCGVQITIAQYFDKNPSAGFLPIQVKIENHSGSARKWDCDFSSPMTAFRGDVFESAKSFTVEDGAIRTFDLLVPIPPSPRATYNYSQIGVQISGYGVKNPRIILPSNSNRTGKPETVFIGLSNKVAERSWGVLEKCAVAASYDLFGTKLDPDFFPTDWRAFAGVSAIWISDLEWNKLVEPAKLALKNWIAAGGQLTIVAQDIASVALQDFGGEGPDSGKRVGLGTVSVQAWDGHEINPEATLKSILAIDTSLSDRLTDTYRAHWAAPKAVGALKLDLPLLIGFMGLFAALVGPVNLFVFARSGARHRLFWTTPLIAMSASLLLAGLIVLQDGFGGAGQRLIFVLLMPAEKKEIVLQEQIARTGVILKQDFQIDETVLFAPILLDNSSTMAKHRYSISENHFGGDWFRSRTVQAQFAQAIRPTRAQVELINAAELDSGAAPVILSSIAATIEDLTFVDAKGRIWRGENVRTGQKVTLAAADGKSFARCRALMHDDAGPGIQRAMQDFEKRTNFFHGITGEVTDTPIETLPGLRWTRQQVLYAGVVSGI